MFKRITFFVLACHLFFFVQCFVAKKTPAPKPQERHIIVKMANPPVVRPSVQTPAAVAPRPAKPLPVSEKQPVVTKAKAKTSSTAKPEKKIKTDKPKPRQKTSAPISDALLEQLQESIAKIEKKPDKCRQKETFVLPERPTSFAERPSSSSPDYLAGVRESLIQQLHLALNLPDYGEVKVQLELSENGAVRNVKVLKAASQKNREYLERELPRMSFSSLAVNKLTAKERTFVISFHNEM